MTVDAIHGRMLFKSDPPLECLEAISKDAETTLALYGNTVTYSFPCDSLAALQESCFDMAYVLPVVLNLGLPDPPVVETVRGMVGPTAFRWEYLPEECQTGLRTVTKEQLEDFALDALDNVGLFRGIANRRLLAALSYFHSAVRLYTAGHNRWEFIAEAVLNYTKCLEVLFVASSSTMEDVRTELGRLGYDADDIEQNFIPILLLRNSMDVGHHRIDIFPQEDLITMYRYIESREVVFRDLLTRLVNAVKSSSYAVRQPEDLNPSREEKRRVKRLVESMNYALAEGRHKRRR